MHVTISVRLKQVNKGHAYACKLLAFGLGELVMVRGILDIISTSTYM